MPKFPKKKVTHFVKNYVKPVKFWMNDVWTFPGKNKKTSLYLKKKKQAFRFWMNEWPMNFFAKKKYGTFAMKNIIYALADPPPPI